MKRRIAVSLSLCIMLTGCQSAGIAKSNPIQTPQNTSETLSSSDSSSTEKSVIVESQFKTITETEFDVDYSTTISDKEAFQITKTPPVLALSQYMPKLSTFPSIEDSPNGEIDIRSTDVSQFDLSNRFEDLMKTSFDELTKWPETLPKEFDIEQIKAFGMDPGLSVKELHKQNITGKNIGIAIIDQSLLVDHVEYKDQLKLYEEIHCSNDYASMHGPAVASIAVGKNVGVAPNADLYYIAVTHGQLKDGKFTFDYKYVAKSIERILEINQQLPSDKKIRVISISLGFNPSGEGYAELTKAVKQAEKDNIFVMHVDALEIMGSGRNPLGNPNELTSYKKGLFWEKTKFDMACGLNTTLVPMDSRTTASPTSPTEYVFYASGGMSWAVPYVAGLYALGCEVDPELNPSQFVKALNATRTSISFSDKESTYIINPTGIMDYLKTK